MEETNKTIQNWTENACKRIKYYPDRLAMERELTDHFEDHRDALVEVGYTELEAKDHALEALGDADEVGEQLAEVFNTRWSRIWQLSKTAFWTLLIVFLLGKAVIRPTSMHRAEYIDLAFRRDSAQMYFNPAAYEKVNAGLSDDTLAREFTFTNWTAGESDAADAYMGFDWSVEHWARLHERLEFNDLFDEGEPDPRENELAVVLLKLQDHAIYPGEPVFYHSDLHAVDDAGNRYDLQNSSAERFLTANSMGRVLHQYYVQLMLPGVQPDAQWLELRAGTDGDTLCLRIDLTEGEVLQ